MKQLIEQTIHSRKDVANVLISSLFLSCNSCVFYFNLFDSKLHLIAEDDDSEIRRVELHRTDYRYVDRVVAGLLRNMDTRTFYVDDSETE